MAQEVKVLDKTFEVVPDWGEVAVGDASLRTELPHNGLNLREVVVVHAREQVVLNVVVDASVDPASDWASTAGCGRHLLVQEALLLGILFLHSVGGQVDTIIGMNDDSPEPLMESIPDKCHETLQGCFKVELLSYLEWVNDNYVLHWALWGATQSETTGKKQNGRAWRSWQAAQ